jgi:hypothetical protein
MTPTMYTICIEKLYGWLVEKKGKHITYVASLLFLLAKTIFVLSTYHRDGSTVVSIDINNM